jgi:hypothetical protein
MELASLDSRSQANKVVASIMRGLLGRLTRISAGLIADALPQPIPRLVLGSPSRPRFAPFATLVEEVSVPTNSESTLRRWRSLMGIRWSRHSRRAVPTQRSAAEFARGG